MIGKLEPFFPYKFETFLKLSDILIIIILL